MLCLFLLWFEILSAQINERDPHGIISEANFQKSAGWRNKLLKKAKWIKYDTSFIFLPTYSLSEKSGVINFLNKNDFVTGSFLNNVEPLYSFPEKKKNSIMAFYSRIYDSCGNMIGSIDEFSITGLLLDSIKSQFLFDIFNEQKLLYMFHIDKTNAYIAFGVAKSGEILVINASEQYSFILPRGVYKLDFFMNNYWEVLFPYESDSITIKKREYAKK